MSGIAEGRLREERKGWRKDHPIGFVARPKKADDGSTDLMIWDVVIPGKKGGLFDGCEFNLLMEFSADYPSKAPVVKFVPEIWHLNCWKGGRVCLNILNEPDGTWHGQWSVSITIKEILMAVQHLLDNPFPAGARPDVQALYERDRPSRAAGVQMRPV
mmetsp:Transcript_10890/g.33598  ORF Transcript_10890/g.33598 Transcript_10890/m.33598 type:complete len:158 (+) Transcript_10890:516-989(+)